MGFGIGERIKNLRVKKGLTQDELAERLHVSRHLVSKWEIGKRYPTYSAIEEIADVFSIEPELLILADALVYEELDSCIPEKMDPKQAAILIDEFVGSLSPEYADIFLLRYFSFNDTKTIGRKLGKSDGTIRNRLVTIRKQLRAFLERCVK